MYLYNGGQVMSLNMSGPRMTLAPLIRVLVSSDGSWSKQPRLVFKNIEVMDSRAHLDQQFTESSIYIPSNKVSPVDVRQNVLDNRIFSPIHTKFYIHQRILSKTDLFCWRRSQSCRELASTVSM